MRHLIGLLLVIGISCTEGTRPKGNETESTFQPNITREQMDQLQWLNPPESFDLAAGTLSVAVSKGTDFFNSPEDQSVIGSAPLLFKNTTGDFVAKALVQPDFHSQWNGVSLMLHIDSLHWIKLAFENSDATGPGIVTVVTNNTSDDANGVVLNDHQRVWLALARKNNLYAMHWSTNGKDYFMARLTSLPSADTVKIGLEMQSPVGEAAIHKIHAFEVDSRTVEDLRKLN